MHAGRRETHRIGDVLRRGPVGAVVVQKQCEHERIRHTNAVAIQDSDQGLLGEGIADQGCRQRSTPWLLQDVDAPHRSIGGVKTKQSRGDGAGRQDDDEREVADVSMGNSDPNGAEA